jgi:hypothetical protein
MARRTCFGTAARAAAALLATGPAAANGGNPFALDFYEIGYQVYSFDSASTPSPPLPTTLPGKSAGDMIFITSKLVNWADRANPWAPVVATLHSVCTFTTDPHVFLVAPIPIANGATRPPPGTHPDYTMRCSQTIAFVGEAGEPFARKQLQLEGIVDQVGFEAGKPSYLAVTGGTGRYKGVSGEAVVTQLVFPNIKRIQIALRPV